MPSTPVCSVTGQQSQAVTSPQLPKAAASEWTIEEVIQYIAATDPTLAIHADLFRKHVSSIYISLPSIQNKTIIKSLSSLLGNRWKGSFAVKLRHDDAVHGPETGSSAEDLQSR